MTKINNIYYLYFYQVSATLLLSVLVEGVPTPPAVQMVLVCAAILFRILVARSLTSRLTTLTSETQDLQVRGVTVRQHLYYIFTIRRVFNIWDMHSQNKANKQ